MPRPRETFEECRPLDFREPSDVLEADQLYTVFEIARCLQGLDPEADLDPGTEDVLLDWAIPWMLINREAFVFAEPEDPGEPGYYGLADV